MIVHKMIIKQLIPDVQNSIYDYIPYRENYDKVLRQLRKIVIHLYWWRLTDQLHLEYVFDLRDFWESYKHVKNNDRSMNSYDYDDWFFEAQWRRILNNYNYVE